MLEEARDRDPRRTVVGHHSMLQALEPVIGNQLQKIPNVHNEYSGGWLEVDPPVLMEDLEAADFVWSSTVRNQESECRLVPVASSGWGQGG